MLDKTQVTKLAIGGFGAAMATVFAVPEVHATILPLNFNPGSVAAGTSANYSRRVKASTAKGGYGYFWQYNGNGGNKHISIYSRIYSMATVAAGQHLSPASFAGGSSLKFGGADTGIFYVGFRSRGNNVGWFTIDLGGVGNPVVYGNSRFGNEGENVIVGKLATGVPEPAEWGMLSLGLLALGAAGLRRRREARKAAELH